MKTKEQILKDTVGNELYEPNGIVYVPKETALKAMKTYARLKHLEKLKQILKDYPDHFSMSSVIQREIDFLENVGNDFINW